MENIHKEKEFRGKEQFEALPSITKERFDEASFIEGFVYGTIDTERRLEEKKVLP